MLDPSINPEASGPPPAGAPHLLERTDELRALQGAIAEAVAGRGSVVVIEGQAGIGKTALLSASGEWATAAGATVLTARGAEMEREFAFGAVRQLFEEQAWEAGADAFTGQAALAAPLLGMPVPRNGVPVPSGDETSYAVVHGLYWFCVHLAGQGPVALFVDDVQWLDPSSLRFLAYLGARLRDLGIVVVLAVREGESRGTRLPPHLIHAADTIRLRPQPLSPAAARQLVQAALPGAEPELCDRCHAATAGNPLFLRALLAELVTQEPPAPGQLVDVLSRAPEGIRAMVAARLERVSPPGRALARAVAVLGSDVLLRHAAAVGGLSPTHAAEAADELAEAGLLERGRPLRFEHPIVRAAILDELPPAALAGAHRAAAHHLAEDGASAEQVAAHLLAADPISDPWSCDGLRQAAREARDRGAPEAAVSSLRRALLEPPAEAERAAVLLELGHAEALAFEPAPAIEHLLAGMALTTDPDAHLRAALVTGTLIAATGTVAEGVEVMERALVACPSADPSVIDELEGHLATIARTDAASRGIAGERLTSVLQRASARTLETPSALAAYAADLVMTGAPADEVAHAARRVLAAQAGATPLPGSFVVAIAGRCLIAADRLDEAERALRDQIESLSGRGAHALTLPDRIFLAESLRRRGRFVEAEALLREALDEAGPWTHARPAALASLVPLLVETGRGKDGKAALRAHGIVGEPAALPANYQTTMALCARGALNLHLGAHRYAEGDLMECGARCAAIDELAPALMPWRSLLARTLVARGDTQRAYYLAYDELELARSFGAPRAISVALRAVAAMETSPAARVAPLREAVDVLAASPAVTARAEALLSLGEALLASDAEAEGKLRLEQAVDVALRTGAVLVRRRAAKQLGKVGRRAPVRPATGPQSLTRAERRVAELAARGLGNREVADELTVTVRTVEFHLTAAYRKLEITSRHELPAALDPAQPPDLSRGPG